MKTKGTGSVRGCVHFKFRKHYAASGKGARSAFGVKLYGDNFMKKLKLTCLPCEGYHMIIVKKRCLSQNELNQTHLVTIENPCHMKASLLLNDRMCVNKDSALRDSALRTMDVS